MKKLKEELKYGKKGITLIALVVTIIVLIILASISINLLFGDNGLVTMAQKAKNEYEQAAKNEEQELAGVFERNYVTYNGQLHVEGTKLMNEHNEEIQLKGITLSNVNSKRFTLGQLQKVKDMGVNLIRLGLSNTANDTEKIDDMCKVIDNCIELNLYVDLIYWNSGNILENIDIAKTYFEYIINKYDNNANMLYEICNEPSNEWSEIKEYAEEIIPIVRTIANNNIILVGTPDACGDVNAVIGNTLNYENIMYVKHYYTPSSSDANNPDYAISKRKLSRTLDNNIPVFISEWSAGSANGSYFHESDANLFSKIIKKYNLSYCYYNFDAGNYSYNIIQAGKFDNFNVNTDLTESGKYFYSLLNNTLELSETIEDKILLNYGIHQQFEIWDEAIRNNTQNISFLHSINNITNSEYIYNLSNNGVGNIIAYVVKNQNNLYDIYIVSDSTIYLPEVSSYLFWNFANLESITFENINTSKASNMSYMFSGCTSLKNVNFDKFDTSNVTKMTSMFAGNSNLENLDLSSFNTKNVADFSYMFLNNSNLQTLNLKNAQFNASIYSYMFSGSSPKIIVKDEQAKEFIHNIKNTLEIEVSKE